MGVARSVTMVSSASPMIDRLVTPVVRTEDDVPLDRALRPKGLGEFVGQTEATGNLALFIAAARSRAETLDHVLLAGPPGLGKTTLAQIVAAELGVGFRATSGPVLARAGDLAAILTNLQPRDVLFIDEIHRLNATVEEILYPAMEDYKLDLIIGEGPAARSVQIDIPPFTLVAATTRAGLLATPLRDRFGIPIRLSYYTPEELTQIVTRAGRLMQLSLDPAGAFEVAKRARGTPRVANRLLRRVRDIATVEGWDIVDADRADHALVRLQVDQQGLDSLDRDYLRILAEHYGGGPAGIETLAATIGEERDVLEDVIEPYLMQRGLIQRTPRGRMISQSGWRYLGLSPPNGQQQRDGDLFT
jgi:Holliday junction DNA helicase RuvB